jgi:hypothetical protein
MFCTSSKRCREYFWKHRRVTCEQAEVNILRGKQSDRTDPLLERCKSEPSASATKFKGHAYCLSSWFGTNLQVCPGHGRREGRDGDTR